MKICRIKSVLLCLALVFLLICTIPAQESGSSAANPNGSSESTTPTEQPTSDEPKSGSSAANPNGSSESTTPAEQPTSDEPNASEYTTPTEQPTSDEPSTSENTTRTEQSTSDQPGSAESTTPTEQPTSDEPTFSETTNPTTTKPKKTKDERILDYTKHLLKLIKNHPEIKGNVTELIMESDLLNSGENNTKNTPGSSGTDKSTKEPSTTDKTSTSENTTSTEQPTSDQPGTSENTTRIEHPPPVFSKTTNLTTKRRQKTKGRRKDPSPESSHFAVVFLIMVALLFGLYALYHNRQKIIAVVVEGRSSDRRGNRERYRKLDSNAEEPQARIKNSNEVYVY